MQGDISLKEHRYIPKKWIQKLIDY